MDDPKPIDLAARRKAKKSGQRKPTLGGWKPPLAVVAWAVFLAVAALGYFGLGYR